MSLMCGCDYEDGPSVLNEKFVKAKKSYKCCECGARINIGDEYQYTFGVWDGLASTYHTCEACAGVEISLSAMGFCFSYGYLREAYWEYLHEYLGLTEFPKNHLILQNRGEVY